MSNDYNPETAFFRNEDLKIQREISGPSLDTTQLREGQIVTLSFLPEGDIEIAPLQLIVIKPAVTHKSFLTATANGGPLGWLDQEVEVPGSVYVEGAPTILEDTLGHTLTPDILYHTPETVACDIEIFNRDQAAREVLISAGGDPAKTNAEMLPGAGVDYSRTIGQRRLYPGRVDYITVEDPPDGEAK